jgi:CO dehydrogenase/acetyl-CoA synthase beta subunit
MKTVEQLKQESQRKIAPFKTDFPQLFSKLEWLETLDGWNDLIWELSRIIQDHINSKVPEELKDQIYYTQIKQKFGSLRVYMSNETPYIQGAIDMAEAASAEICEHCGNKANIQDVKGWLIALCDLHYNEEMKK